MAYTKRHLVFQNGMFFFLPGAHGWIEHCDLGKGDTFLSGGDNIPSPFHSLSSTLRAFVTIHRALAMSQKKKKKKTPSGENSHREPDWPWATAHVVASNNSFSLNWLVFTTPVWLNIWVSYIREVGGGEWILNDSQVAGLADNPCSPSCK